jgi:hypothetical protein
MGDAESVHYWFIIFRNWQGKSASTLWGNQGLVPSMNLTIKKYNQGWIFFFYSFHYHQLTDCQYGDYKKVFLQ